MSKTLFAQRIRQGLKFSSFKLPASRQTQIAVAVADPVAADVQTLGIEAADADVVTARVETRRADVDVLEESDTTNLKIGRDKPAHLGGVRHLLERGQKLVLIVPVFAGRVRHGRLLDGEPSERRLVFVGELLVGIPPTRLRVEVGGLDLPNIERGHHRRRYGHDGVTVVLEPLEHIQGRQTFGKLVSLLVGVHDVRASLGDFFRCNEICAENGLCEIVIRRFCGETTNTSDQIVLPLVSATEESLKAVLVGIHGGERLARAILRESVVLLALIRGDRIHRHTP